MMLRHSFALLLAVVAVLLCTVTPRASAQLVVPANSYVLVNSSLALSSGISLATNSTLRVVGLLTVNGTITGSGLVDADSFDATYLTSLSPTATLSARTSGIVSSLSSGTVSAVTLSVLGTLSGTATAQYVTSATVLSVTGNAQVLSNGVQSTLVISGTLSTNGLVQGELMSITGPIVGNTEVQAGAVTVSGMVSASPAFEASSVTFSSTAIISNSATVTAITVSSLGSVVGSLTVTSSVFTLGGSVTGTVTGTASSNFTVVSGTSISPNSTTTASVFIQSPVTLIPNGISLSSTGQLRTSWTAGTGVATFAGGFSGIGQLTVDNLNAVGVSAFGSNTYTVLGSTLLSSMGQATLQTGSLNATGLVSGTAVVRVTGTCGGSSTSRCASGVAVIGSIGASAVVTVSSTLTVLSTISGSANVSAASVTVDTIASGPTISASSVTTRQLSGAVSMNGVNSVAIVGTAGNAGLLSIDSTNSWPSSAVTVGPFVNVNYVASTGPSISAASVALVGATLTTQFGMTSATASYCLPIFSVTSEPTTFFTNQPPYSAVINTNPPVYISYSGRSGPTFNIQLVGPTLFSTSLPALHIPEGNQDKLHTRFEGTVVTLSYCPDSRLQINALVDWGTDRQLLNNVQGSVYAPTSNVRGAHTFAGALANGPSVSSFTITVYANLNSATVLDTRTFTSTVTVDNVVPTIPLSSTLATPTLSGTPYSLTLNPVVDPGNDTVTLYTVHWGDNQQTSINCVTACVFPVQLTHTYAAFPRNRTYVIAVDLLDNDGYWENAGVLSIVSLAFVVLGPAAPTATIPPPPLAANPVPLSPPVNPPPASTGGVPPPSVTVGGSVQVNGVSLTYSLLGQFTEFVPNVNDVSLTIGQLAGSTVQLVVSNVVCGLSQLSGASYSQQVRLTKATGSGVFDLSNIAGGQTLVLCVRNSNGQFTRYSDVALQTISVTSVRYNAPIQTVSIAPPGSNVQRAVERSVLIPRQAGVTQASLRTVASLQVGDSFGFATSAAACGTGPSADATDATTVGTNTLDFSQIPSRSVVSPCVRKAGFQAWSFFPYQVVGIVEPASIEIIAEPAGSSSFGVMLTAPLVLLVTVLVMMLA